MSLVNLVNRYFCKPIFLQEIHRRKASEEDASLSDCAKKGIAGKRSREINIPFIKTFERL